MLIHIVLIIHHFIKIISQFANQFYGCKLKCYVINVDTIICVHYRFLYWWITRMKMLIYFSSHICYCRAWVEEVRRNKNKATQPSLYWTLFRTFGMSYTLFGLLLFFEVFEIFLIYHFIVCFILILTYLYKIINCKK